MAMLRSNFPKLLVENLREVFFLQYKQKTSIYPRLFEILSSKKKMESEYSVASLGMLAEKVEGNPLSYDDFIGGYQTDFTHTTFAKGIRFSEELIEDELYRVMSQRSKALARSAWYRKEYDHASLFNNAFSTSYTGGDSVALCSASHPRADGGTVQSNTAGAVDLTLANLETTCNAFAALKDDRGLLIGVTPKYLLVPRALEYDAFEITKSSGKPFTADNEANFFQGRLTVIVWDFLTDTDAWFVLSDKSDGAPISFNRVPTSFKEDGDFDTGDLKMKARTRYSYGWRDWRWVYGGSG